MIFIKRRPLRVAGFCFSASDIREADFAFFIFTEDGYLLRGEGGPSEMVEEG